MELVKPNPKLTSLLEAATNISEVGYIDPNDTAAGVHTVNASTGEEENELPGDDYHEDDVNMSAQEDLDSDLLDLLGEEEDDKEDDKKDKKDKDDDDDDDDDDDKKDNHKEPDGDEKECPECGAKVEPQLSSCPKCGHKMHSKESKHEGLEKLYMGALALSEIQGMEEVANSLLEVAESVEKLTLSEAGKHRLLKTVGAAGALGGAALAGAYAHKRGAFSGPMAQNMVHKAQGLGAEARKHFNSIRDNEKVKSVYASIHDKSAKLGGAVKGLFKKNESLKGSNMTLQEEIESAELEAFNESQGYNQAVEDTDLEGMLEDEESEDVEEAAEEEIPVMEQFRAAYSQLFLEMLSGNLRAIEEAVDGEDEAE